MSSVAVTLLTWNSIATIKRTLDVTFHNAGRKWDELLWVDNGSDPDQLTVMEEVMAEYGPMTRVFYPQNTGTQRGFNTCMSTPRSDYIVTLAPDCVMPDNWLSIFMDYVEKIPNTGVATMYDVPAFAVPERYRKTREPELVNGLRILRAMPLGLPIIKRSILSQVGYHREDFSLYGWGDVEWAFRIERILPTLGYQCYVLPDHTVVNLSSQGALPFNENSSDSRERWEWKQKQMNLETNHQVMAVAREENWPFYSPY